MAGTHSLFSASKAPMWARCSAALAAGQGIPDGGPKLYSAEGTAYHAISERALRERAACESYVGEVVEADGFKFTIDAENAAFAEVYCTAIRREWWRGDVLLEEALDTSDILGIPGQGGTSDAVVLGYADDTLDSHDLKFGKGEKVFAWVDPGPDLPRWRGMNEQVGLYLAAARRKYEMLHDWKKFRAAIHQPRIGWFDEVVVTGEELDEFCAYMQQRAQAAKTLLSAQMEMLVRNMTPGEKQCRWCPVAKVGCPGQNQAIADMFPDESKVQRAAVLDDAQLNAARNRVAFVEQWIKDVKEEAYRRALNGATLADWKLVEGRQGNRAWVNPDEVKELLGNLDIDVTHEEPALKTPTQMEKALKTKHKSAWAALNGDPGEDGKLYGPCYIVRAPGSKTLVPNHDNRSASASGVEFGETVDDLL